MFSLKTVGKYRKYKSFGLVGCMGLALVTGGCILVSPTTSVYADVIQGGSDINDVDVHSKSAEGVAMTYTTYDSGTSGKQTASGSGVFVAPNVMVTVAHNYYDKNQEDKSAVLRGGESARSYVVMNSETEKNNKVPTSGVSETLEKDSIHLYNGKDFGKDYSNDLAAVVTKKPIEAMTGGEDSPRELSTKEVSTGDSISMVGYPNDFSTPNLSEETKARLKDGKAYSVSTTVSSLNKDSGAVTYHSSALGGFSGAPLFNEKGEVVGIHQHGTNTSNAPESERIGGGTIFTEKHRAWIRSMIDKYGIKGWYIDGANRYYYDENHIALRDVEKEIDGVLYSFDSKGLGTVVKGSEKGRVILRIEDSKGNRVISDKVLQTGEVGSLLEFHLRQNSEFKDLLTKSPTSKVVSYGGVSVNKPITDSSWSDEYVSKLALGDTVIKLVVDQVIESAKPKPKTELTDSKPKADFSRTEVGSVSTGDSSKHPKPSEVVRHAPNGVENFGASAYIQTSDGTGSGTLIAPDLLLTVAHNFLTVKGSDVVTKSGKENTVYRATFPNGKSITFSDEDISYWNKKDSVFGFKHDLALVRLKEKVEGIRSAELVSSSTVPKEGDLVSVYGYPDGKLKPVLDSKVVGISDFGSGIRAISYNGTKPGASGGGLYDDKGTLIGVHQNGVEGSRSGGLVLSKEQRDWVRSYIEGQPKDPVYVKDEVVVDEKDKGVTNSKDEKPNTPSAVSDSEPLISEGLPAFSGGVSDYVPLVREILPAFEGGVVDSEPLVLGVSEYIGTLSEEKEKVVSPKEVGSSVLGSKEVAPEVLTVPEFTGGVSDSEPLVLEVPAYTSELLVAKEETELNTNGIIKPSKDYISPIGGNSSSSSKANTLVESREPSKESLSLKQEEVLKSKVNSQAVSNSDLLSITSGSDSFNKTNKSVQVELPSTGESNNLALVGIGLGLLSLGSATLVGKRVK